MINCHYTFDSVDGEEHVWVTELTSKLTEQQLPFFLQNYEDGVDMYDQETMDQITQQIVKKTIQQSESLINLKWQLTYSLHYTMEH